MADLVGEAHRGAQQYPLLLDLTVRLYHELNKSLEVFLHPAVEADSLQSENFRLVLQKTVEMMAKIEHKLMRGNIMRAEKY